MNKDNFFSFAFSWLYCIIFPALLLAVTYLLGGARFDTNDDPTLALLLQGVAAARPLSDLHLYFLGWAQLTAVLYTWQPIFPWYDLLQVTWLYAALAGIFYLLTVVVSSNKRSGYLILLGGVLFVSSYALHLLQINFTRPALLLGAVAAGLLALPASSRSVLIIRWLAAGFFFAAGWGIRPAAAELGLLLLAPISLLRPVWHWVAAMLYVVLVSGTLMTVVHLTTTPAEVQYARLNEIRTGAFDYQHYIFTLRTPTDSLACATLRLGSGPYDAKLISKDFLRRCLRPAAMSTTTALHGWADAVKLLLRQWQPLAWVLLLCQWSVVLCATWRGQLGMRNYQLWVFVAYQLFFWMLYLGIGIYFHPVARVAQPMITVFLLGNFLLLASLEQLTLTVLPWRMGWVIIAGVALLFTVRHDFYLIREGHQREQEHAKYLEQLTHQTAGTILVEGGLYEELDNLSLFKSYGLLRYQRILSLCGWSTFDPSRPELYRYLTGQTDVATALLLLGRRSDVTWVFEPDLALVLQKYLNARCQLPAATAIILMPVAGHTFHNGPQQYIFREVRKPVINSLPSYTH